MYPVFAYKVGRNLLGLTRWQAEMDNQQVEYCRRALTEAGAMRKLSSDLNKFWEGRFMLMQRVVLPRTIKLRRLHDSFCRSAHS